MKKSLLSLLVFALVFTLVVPAFAAVPADVTDAKQKDAVAKLSALGVVEGYPDGTFKPGNTITRAEFSKIVAYLAGYGAAAEYLTNVNTGFKDVKGDHWAAGFISVAADRGYVKGYPDGTFKPNANVTYEEAVTVLLRVLGYNDEGLTGSWPTNYVIQGNSLGLMANTKFASKTAATRGDVAVMGSTALDKDVVVYSKDISYFVSTGYLLLEKAFGTEFRTGVVYAPALNKDGEINISGASKATADLYTSAPLADLLGSNVKYLELDGKVTFVQAASNSTATGTLQADADTTVSGDVYGKLKINNIDYFVAQGAVVYLNGNPATLGDLKENASVKLFLNSNNTVRFVVATTYQLNDKALDEAPVTIYGGYRLTVDDGGVDKSVLTNSSTVVTLNGNPSSAGNLAKGDILRIQLVPNSATATSVGTAAKIEATRNTVTGKVTSFSSTSKTVVVDGTTYTLSDVSLFSASDVNKTVKIYLNADGKVVKKDLVTTASASATGIYVGVEVRTVTSDTYKTFATLNVSGELKEYEVTSVPADLVAGDLASVSGTTITEVPVITGAYIDNVNASNSTFRIAGDNYYADSATKFYVVTKDGSTVEDISVGSFADLVSRNEHNFDVVVNPLPTHTVTIAGTPFELATEVVIYEE